MVKNNKIRLGAVLFVLVMIIQLTVSVFAYPAPTDLVYDGAGVLSESTIRLVKKTNEDLKNGTCVAVCTVNTTGEESIDKYALGLSQLRIYDTDKRSIFQRFDLTDEVPEEPEDVSVYKGKIYLNTNSNKIYVIKQRR